MSQNLPNLKSQPRNPQPKKPSPPKLPSSRKQLGNQGEQHAKKLLLSKGFVFLEQNFTTRFGEIDLIFLDTPTVVFVEVKTRLSLDLGTPEEAITKKKLRNLQKAAEIFLTKNDVWLKHPVRIDVVAIEMYGKEVKEMRHYEAVY